MPVATRWPGSSFRTNSLWTFRRQREREPGAASGDVLGYELAALGAGKVAGDGEAEAGTAAGWSSGPGGAMRVGPVEALEDTIQALWWDTRSRVGHRRLDAFICCLTADGYGSFRRREAEG